MYHITNSSNNLPVVTASHPKRVKYLISKYLEGRWLAVGRKYLNQDIRQPTENRTHYLPNKNHRLNITPFRVVNYVYIKIESGQIKDDKSCCGVWPCFKPISFNFQKCYILRSFHKAIIRYKHKSKQHIYLRIWLWLQEKAETCSTSWTIKYIFWNYIGCFFSCLTDKLRPDTIVIY